MLAAPPARAKGWFRAFRVTELLERKALLQVAPTSMDFARMASIGIGYGRGNVPKAFVMRSCNA